MVSPGEQRLGRVLRRYTGDEPINDDYLGMYLTPQSPWTPHDNPLDRAFASIHGRLDFELETLNNKARGASRYPGHFNAENSRQLLKLIDEVEELKLALEKAGKSLTVAPEYERVLVSAKEWLKITDGSTIPEDFVPVKLEKYDTIFELGDAAIELAVHAKVDLVLVDQGSYAFVHKFEDPNYGITIARKKLKPSAEEQDVERFRREYEMMKDLDFPYILKVYRYDEGENSYTMEYCQNTLEKYIKLRNNGGQLSFSARRRIALQFLYGLNYLHTKGICHRDLSMKNILLRVFADGAVTVKLSDFGLAKHRESDFTKTETDIRGTIVDPALHSFKHFQPVNDIYVVGFVLSYVFGGISRLLPASTPLGEIVQKCSHTDTTLRYQKVLEIIKDVENLATDPDGAPA